MRFLVAGCSLGVLVAGSACAQYVISSHSGVVQYVEGRAFLGDKPVEPKFGQFPDIKENQEFRTEDGRAEILLTPGVFLRIGENSSIRMLSTRLTDTRVEVLSGSAMIESTEIPKDNAVELVYKKDSIRLQKQGLYRVDTEPARFAVYEGEAVVTDPSGQLTLHSGKHTNLGGVLMAENFDRKAEDQDALYRWSDRRASYVAQANVASASAVNGRQIRRIRLCGRIRRLRRARLWLRLGLGSGYGYNPSIPGQIGCLIRCSECTPTCHIRDSVTARLDTPTTAPQRWFTHPLMAAADTPMAAARNRFTTGIANRRWLSIATHAGASGFDRQQRAIIQRIVRRRSRQLRWRAAGSGGGGHR